MRCVFRATLRSGCLAAHLGLALLLGLGACTEPPPPDKPPEPAPEPPPPPPPPKPTCKAMNDMCAVEASTRVPIPGTSYAFTPPAGWQYATLEEASVAQVGDKGAVLAFGSFEPPTSLVKVNDARKQAVKSLAELVLIEVGTTTMSFDRPAVKPMKGLSFKLWEREAKRSGEQGALLIISAPLKGRELIGVGFAVKGDSETSTTILKVLESIGMVEEASAPKEEPKKEPGK
jgi:hypothetical protein